MWTLCLCLWNAKHFDEISWVRVIQVVLFRQDCFAKTSIWPFPWLRTEQYLPSYRNQWNGKIHNVTKTQGMRLAVEWKNTIYKQKHYFAELQIKCLFASRLKPKSKPYKQKMCWWKNELWFITKTTSHAIFSIKNLPAKQFQFQTIPSTKKKSNQIDVSLSNIPQYYWIIYCVYWTIGFEFHLKKKQTQIREQF